MEYKAFSLSDMGKVRTNNEDSSFATEKAGVFMVADGMGGHKAGEVASQVAKETLVQRLVDQPSTESLDHQLQDSFLQANEKIRTKAVSGGEFEGMGCTCAVLALRENEFFIAHVGDSRIYLHRKGTLKQVTRDHSYVEELFIRGLITEEEKIDHPYKHQITRYLGCSSKLEVDITSGPIMNGDVFLLCTDGLSEEVSFQKLEEIFGRDLDPQEAANAFVGEALKNGGRDNVTVVVVKVIGKKTSFFKKILGW